MLDYVSMMGGRGKDKCLYDGGERQVGSHLLHL